MTNALKIAAFGLASLCLAAPAWAEALTEKLANHMAARLSQEKGTLAELGSGLPLRGMKSEMFIAVTPTKGKNKHTRFFDHTQGDEAGRKTGDRQRVPVGMAKLRERVTKSLKKSSQLDLLQKTFRAPGYKAQVYVGVRHMGAGYTPGRLFKFKVSGRKVTAVPLRPRRP